MCVFIDLSCPQSWSEEFQHHEGSENAVEEVGEGVRARESGEGREMLSPTRSNQPKSSIGSVELSRSHHLQRSQWQCILTGNGFVLFVCFLLRMWLLVDYHAAVDSAVPMHIWAAISRLTVLSKKRWILGRGIWWDMR